MSATHASQSNTTTAPVLYLALELSWNAWKLAFTVGLGQKARLRTIPARNSIASRQTAASNACNDYRWSRMSGSIAIATRAGRVLSMETSSSLLIKVRDRGDAESWREFIPIYGRSSSSVTGSEGS
jgi:hypothetical protein